MAKLTKILNWPKFEQAEFEDKIFKTGRNRKYKNQNGRKESSKILKLAETLAKYFTTDRNEIILKLTEIIIEMKNPKFEIKKSRLVEMKNLNVTKGENTSKLAEMKN